MKKLLNACLVLTSLLGYLEWGGGNHAFLFEVEYQLLFHPKNASDLVHPAVCIPLIGQLLLLISLFQRTPKKALTIAGAVCLGLMLLLILLIGIMGANVKIIASCLPFFITVVLMIIHNKRTKAVS